jgi:hypothetical protein
LIATATIGKGEVEETYECQQCGETKKIYELISLIKTENWTIKELKERIEAKREAVEKLEFKKRELEKRLKGPRRKDYMEAKRSQTPAGIQQPKQSEPPPKTIKIRKKKRKFF